MGGDDPNYSSTSCTIQEKPATVPPVQPVVKAAHANLGQTAQGLVVAGAQIQCFGGQSSAKRGDLCGLGDLQKLNGSPWEAPTFDG